MLFDIVRRFTEIQKRFTDIAKRYVEISKQFTAQAEMSCKKLTPSSIRKPKFSATVWPMSESD